MQLAREVTSMTQLLETREREIDNLRQIIEFVRLYLFRFINIVCVSLSSVYNVISFR